MHTTNIYKFSDLPDNLKKVARERIKNFLYDDADLRDTVDNYKSQLQDEFNFWDVEIQYCISYSQGEGASFTGRISEADAAKIVGMTGGENAEDNVIEVVRINHRYVHENSVRIDWDDYAEGQNEAILEPFREWVKDKCRAMFEGFKDDLEGQTSDEAVDAWIEANEPEYIIGKNGELIDW